MAKVDVEKLREQYRLSDVVARRTKLRRRGREFVGLCPFHKEKTPSFTVVDARGFAHCFGCGWNGDIIRYVMQTEHLGFVEACTAIAGGDLPVVPEAERVRAQEEDAQARAAAIGLARAVWAQSVPVEGTPAETYLRSRGLWVRPPRFRFAMTPSWQRLDTGECGPDRPAMVELVTDIDDRPCGIQRIFLSDDGTGKAKMENPKLSLGRPAGGAIRLGARFPTMHVTVVEGPEDGASVYQQLLEEGRLEEDCSVWVACGTSMMPRVLFPPGVRKVTIGGDNNAAGRMAAARARAAYMDRGLEVRAVYPDPAYGDWNDQLRGIKK